MVYMPHPFVILLGKSVRYAARLRGGGSALPGLFVEKINPTFIKDTLSQLPHGVVLVSGTNGKTTTTKMVVALLEAHGLRVFTNRTGSNFTRGVAASLLKEIDLKGNLAADIAVLELDEAHAVHFAKVIPPRYSLFLNVMRDQLDRFGEIDATARLLAKVANATSEAVILNREDARIRTIADNLNTQQVNYFGLDASLLSAFPSDDDMRKVTISASERPDATVTLDAHDNGKATFSIGGTAYTTSLKITGVYNVFNAAAALATAKTVLADEFKPETAITAIGLVTPAFGRGETIVVGGQPLELVLVKNPSGFRLGLKSFPPEGYATMIAINDNYADGRDMSWLWDVDFDSLSSEGVSQVAGVRAYDMAVCLQYDNVSITHVQPELGIALRRFINENASKPKRIYCTYTAMLALRRELAKMTNVEIVA
jgi:UDP-N-acetylmuramyl tripeptide synthase